MGNRFTLAGCGAEIDEIDLKLNNIATDTFMRVLALSSSALAETRWEKGMALWLAEHDQAAVGRGTVGFHINAMPWTGESFQREQAFVLRVLRDARSQRRWPLLGYEPRAEWLLEALDRFAQMIEHMSPECIDAEGQTRWPMDEREPQERCLTHGVYLHGGGCIVCN